jgi:hypothetical protein
MRAVRRFGRTARAGAPWRLALACVWGAFFLIGQAGALAHQYEHMGEPQPEVVCHLCAAGDHFTPLPATARVTPALDFGSPGLRALHVAPARRPMRTAHGVRAPPRSV